ncbi:hypothetical protein PHYPSEUDO_003073 [Phytophthora pseudosyringae]|uniref:Uncharacterized protein n=1 Tax=Phytophthora pseudosyringae TaxID=221518 RepID=A0A8T1WDS0_9STRA|nr:hypothetical protein PHYPSEUDO_003073 [Phytophthora pseudosyringae]
MNGYVRSKCSSEQQLLNELAKLLGAKDVASRKMADVLRALTFFYTSAARGSRIPQSLLTGLCSLLPQLKDKKEITLLKDEHQRIARLALCLLARLIDQFEIQKEMATRLTDSQKTSQEQSADPAEQVLANFLLTLETAVMTPSGLLLPRQRATLRVYAQLCRVFRKREQLVTYTSTLLQQSPVLAYAENPVDAKGKRLPPPAPAQYGAVTGACHALHFHTAPAEQVFVVDKLAQLAFVTPAGTASRHAAKTLLSLLTSTSLNEDRPSNALSVAKAIELYLLKARPRTLLGGDSLTSVYLLRLCGQMYRLPVHQQQKQQNSVVNGTGGSLLESTLLDTSSGEARKQPSDQNPALQGFFVSNALSAQLQEYLMDVVQAAIPEGHTTVPTVVPAVLLVAMEEALRGTSPEASFRKQPNWGSMCIFELVAAALLSLFPAPQDSARLAYSTVTLHRVCRAVQFVAERLDACVLELSAASGQAMVTPIYLNQLTLRIRSLTEHNNAFVACEALRAFVWLLPRCNSSAEQGGDDWATLFWQLETLPFNRIQPERRAAIAWTLFRRCVTTLKSYGFETETPLLSGCLRVVLEWFRVRPCVWHAALLTAIWHTALRECLATLGDAVFASINELFDYHCAPSDSAAPDCLVVKQSALQFLSHREGGMRYAVRFEEWSHPLVLRLTKQILLETCTSQRMSTRALSQMRDEAQAQEFIQLGQQADATLSLLQNKSRQSRQIGISSSAGSENQPFSLDGDPFSDVTAHGAAALTDDDPFSDFRAPEETTTSMYAGTTEHTMLDNSFADAARTKSTTASDFTKWNDATTSCEMAATEASPFIDFKVQADTSFSASTWGDTDNTAAFSNTKAEGFMDSSTPAFSNWGDDSTVSEQTQTTKTEAAFFDNFPSATGNAPESAFPASDTRQEEFHAQGNSFGLFAASKTCVEFKSWSESQTDQKANESKDTTIDISPTSPTPATVPFGEWNETSAFQDTLESDPNRIQHSTTKTTQALFSTDFGAQPTELSPAAADDFGPASDFGPPAEVSGSSEGVTFETQQSTTTVGTTEAASFSTDFGAQPTELSPAAADDFGPASDFGPPAEPTELSPAAADDFGPASDFGPPAEVSGSSEGVTFETQQSTTTVGTTEAASFSTDFGAQPTELSPAAADDFGPASDFGPPAESPAFDSSAIRNGDDSGSFFTCATDLEGVSVGGIDGLAGDTALDFTIDEEVRKPDVPSEVVDEFSDAKEFDEIAEYEAAIPDKQVGGVNFDDEFDEIFGGASTPPAEPVADAANTSLSTGDKLASQPNAGTYDEEFDDIFGEGAASSDDVESMMSTPAEKGKQHHPLGEEDHTASGDEVRTGTPASDFSLS